MCHSIWYSLQMGKFSVQNLKAQDATGSFSYEQPTKEPGANVKPARVGRLTVEEFHRMSDQEYCEYYKDDPLFRRLVEIYNEFYGYVFPGQSGRQVAPHSQS